MSNITTIGIDLAKSVFQVCGLNQARNVIFNKSVKRANFVNFVRQHHNAVLAMEACGSSHHWCRVFTALGFTVRLIPAQHVKAFSRGNKSDKTDALAIAESVYRPNLHDVQAKSLEQQDIQKLLRLRSRFKDARTNNVNQLRGLMSEYGVVLPIGITIIDKQMPFVLEDAHNGLTAIARAALHDLYHEHLRLNKKIQVADKQLTLMAKQHPVAQQLMNLRGIGYLA